MVPSTKKIILSDYSAFLLAVAAPVWWLMFAGALLLGKISVGSFEFNIALLLAAIGTVLTLPILVRRIGTYRRLLSTGRDATGVITSVWFFRDRGRVEYEFDFYGQRVHAGNAIMKNKETRALYEGQSVDLVVDPENPKRAVIRHLYCAEN